MRQFLATELAAPPTPQALEHSVVLAQGVIGLALHAEGNERDRRAEAFTDALRRGRASWLPLVLSQPPWAARGGFTGLLDGLTVQMRGRAERAGTDRNEARNAVTALRLLDDARVAAKGNVNPQLVLANLASDLEPLV